MGAAVSGGADSVAMLVAMADVLGAGRLRVVTVNHNIRPERESGGDAEFVAGLCRSMGVSCRVAEIPRGLVAETARERGGGVEEAARFLRYRELGAFAEGEGLSALCLAHTRGDQLETLLMRFVQGSSRSGGIARSRGVFRRPILDATRAQVESFLRSRGISWRTDSTNSDTAYLRNRIRARLVPVLDAEFPGWGAAAVSGAELSRWDEDFAAAAAEPLLARISRDERGASFPRSEFDGLPPAVRIRVVRALVDAAGFSGRFPHSAMRPFALLAPSEPLSAGACGISLSAGCGFVRACKIRPREEAESGFFVLVEGGRAEFRAGGVEFSYSGGILRAFGVPLVSVGPPFAVRSPQPADSVAAADGSLRPVAKALASWRCPPADRGRAAVVQLLPSQEIAAVLGSPLGLPDWICAPFRPR